ncbi:hypothetical protein GKZ90_0005895 [Flavobacterium sp. MC2016-06]|jgi:hypothetical protein|uniref:hypothetical protein n=1 Tax=Flavobacterium sp. MC2016-06 TaxID=2676308 RepID=UPI0012BB1822|nr:hypothetical protein [Flavobacterium sp. MC2016-06]MBU3857670.1 hypothetical protein [Flavobacterium sp. MC2016-06]
MKYLFTILVLLLIVSCKSIEPKELIGSWKMRDFIDQSGQNGTDKTTFYHGDSLAIEMFANKKLVEKQNGKYKFDTISNIIQIEVGNAKISNIKVLKLTDSEMELLYEKQKKTTRFIRTE